MANAFTDQQQQVTEAFAHYISATYADRFDSYSGEQLQVTGEQPYGTEVIVQTKIVKTKGDSVTSIIGCARTRVPGKSLMYTSTAPSASWRRSARNSTRSFSARALTV